jgi:hypothetical protein
MISNSNFIGDGRLSLLAGSSHCCLVLARLFFLGRFDGSYDVEGWGEDALEQQIKDQELVQSLIFKRESTPLAL